MKNDEESKKEIVPWEAYKPDQIEAVRRIAEVQKRAELSDERFCLGLPTTATTWSRLRRGIYPGDIAGQLAALVPAVRDWSEERAREGVRPKRLTHQTTALRAAAAAAGRAGDLGAAGEQDKLVWYVADTGWGKDVLARELRVTRGASVILCRKSWRGSYYAMLRDMLLHLRGKADGGGAPALEAELLRFLTDNPRLIVFNETEFVGSNGLGLIKSILNETQCAVVILCVPATYDEFCRRGGTDMEQCRRRTVAVIRPERVTPALALAFFAETFEATDTLKTGLRAVVKAANAFGGYSLLRRVQEELLSLTAGAGPADGDVETALALVSATLNLEAAR